MQTEINPEQYRELLELFCEWAEVQEQRIVREGVALSPHQVEDAKLIGVRHPERVRLLEISAMPSPEHPLFFPIVQRNRLIPPETEALTLGYGIYIHSAHSGVRSIVAHELKHVAQKEELGGLRPFYKKYLRECFTYGYPDGPMEREAMELEKIFSNAASILIASRIPPVPRNSPRNP